MYTRGSRDIRCDNLTHAAVKISIGSRPGSAEPGTLYFKIILMMCNDPGSPSFNTAISVFICLSHVKTEIVPTSQLQSGR